MALKYFVSVFFTSCLQIIIAEALWLYLSRSHSVSVLFLSPRSLSPLPPFLSLLPLSVSSRLSSSPFSLSLSVSLSLSHLSLSLSLSISSEV